MSVYRIAVVVSATLVVKASSVEEALEVAHSTRGVILNLSSKQVAISGDDLDSPDLPNRSLSTVGVCMGPSPGSDPDLVHKDS